MRTFVNLGQTMVQVIRAAPQDQRIIQPGRTWEQFRLIQQGLENSPGVKLFFYDGTVEILMPGREHELFSAMIALLLGIFFVEKERLYRSLYANVQVGHFGIE
jgi:Uma2 family endonuclease